MPSLNTADVRLDLLNIFFVERIYGRLEDLLELYSLVRATFKRAKEQSSKIKEREKKEEGWIALWFPTKRG